MRGHKQCKKLKFGCECNLGVVQVAFGESQSMIFNNKKNVWRVGRNDKGMKFNMKCVRCLQSMEEIKNS